MSETCIVHNMGLIPYETAWQMQDSMAGEIASGERPPSLMLLEHPHTYTFGSRGNASNLLWDDEELNRRGVTVHRVDRGGDVTYHGPGQLVGYPLLPLRPAFTLPYKPRDPHSGVPYADYTGYLRKLERTLINTLKRFGVHTEQVEGMTGVWVDPSISKNSKIASIGIKVDVNGISRHGFALNVDPDMSYWEGIIGCGLRNAHEVSLAQLMDMVPSMQQVIEALVEEFGTLFGYKMVISEAL